MMMKQSYILREIYFNKAKKTATTASSFVLCFTSLKFSNYNLLRVYENLVRMICYCCCCCCCLYYR